MPHVGRVGNKDTPHTRPVSKDWKQMTHEERRDWLLEREGNAAYSDESEHTVAFAILGLWRELELQRPGPPRTTPTEPVP